MIKTSISKRPVYAIAVIAAVMLVSLFISAIAPQTANADRPADATKTVIYKGYKYNVELESNPNTGKIFKTQYAFFLGPVNKKKTSYTIPKTMKFRHNGQTITGRVFFAQGNPFLTNTPFKGCTRAKTITCKSAAPEIPSKLLTGCANLRTFKVTGNIYSINKSTFAKCKKLQTIKITGNLEEIGNGAFKGSRNLKTFVVAGKVDRIGTRAFSGCSKLKTFSAKRIATIEKMAFYKCTSLKTFTLNQYKSSSRNESYNKIREKTFYGCTGLKSFVLNSTADIGISAFQNCKGLRSFVSKSSIGKISDKAFMGCTNLQKFECKKGYLDSIGVSAFENCKKLSSFPSIGRADDDFESYVTIGARAFSRCSALPSFTIICTRDPEITDVHILIGEKSFLDCKCLRSFAFVGNRPIDQSWEVEFENGAFSNCINLSTVNNLNQFWYIGGLEAFNGTPAYKQVADQIEKLKPTI